jgi:hypothetical protein
MTPNPLADAPSWTEVICIGCERMLSLTLTDKPVLMPGPYAQARYTTVCMRCRLEVAVAFTYKAVEEDGSG